MPDYCLDGEAYAKGSQIQKKWGNQTMADLTLSGSESICDIGCGDGALTVLLAQKVPKGRVLGIDPSESMIRTAQKQRLPNLEFMVLDALEMDFDQEFDLFFSNSALHWLHDHDLLWEKVIQGLKPGAQVRFKFSANDTGRNFNRAVKKVMARKEFAPHFEKHIWPWYTPKTDDYRDFAGTLGLSELRVWEEAADQVFEDMDALFVFLNPVALPPFLTWLPENQRESFKHLLQESLETQARQEDGTYLEIFRRLNVWARK